MNVDPDDPRLTAYALGELDPTEYALVEAMLIESTECRVVVDEIRQTARLLAEQLQAEAEAHAATMTLNHHPVAESLLKPPGPLPAKRWWRPRTMLLQAVAAVLLVGIALSFLPNFRVRQGPVAVVEPRHRDVASAPAGAAADFGEAPERPSPKSSLEVAWEAKEAPSRAVPGKEVLRLKSYRAAVPGPSLATRASGSPGGDAPAPESRLAAASAPPAADGLERGSLARTAPASPAAGPPAADAPAPESLARNAPAPSAPAAVAPAAGSLRGGAHAPADASAARGSVAASAPMQVPSPATQPSGGRVSMRTAMADKRGESAIPSPPMHGEASAYKDSAKPEAQAPAPAPESAPDSYAFYYRVPQANDLGSHASRGLRASKPASGDDRQAAQTAPAGAAPVVNQQMKSPENEGMTRDANQSRSSNYGLASGDSFANRGAKSDKQGRSVADHESQQNTANRAPQMDASGQAGQKSNTSQQPQQNSASGPSRQNAASQGMQQQAGGEARDQKTVSPARGQNVASRGAGRNAMSQDGEKDAAREVPEQKSFGKAPQQNDPMPKPEQNKAGLALAQKVTNAAPQQTAPNLPRQENETGVNAQSPKQAAVSPAGPQNTLGRAQRQNGMGLDALGNGRGGLQEQPREFARLGASQPPVKGWALNEGKPFERVSPGAQSTFSIDVGWASYSTVRRYLNRNVVPPANAVRIEEMLNYFPAHEPPPAASSEHPFAIRAEIAGCPWNTQHRLARIGVAARPIDQSRRAPCNLVFLIEASGSAVPSSQPPLFQWGFKRLVEQLGEKDRVAIVVEGTESGVVLPSTFCINKAEILTAIEDLRTKAATDRGNAIQLAYDIAAENYIDKGTNRVLLVSAGPSDRRAGENEALVRLAEKKAKSGVALSVLSNGLANRKDVDLADNAAKTMSRQLFLDSRVGTYHALFAETGGTVETVARDVQIQVELNPARVTEFRLLGYDNPALADEGLMNEVKAGGTTISAGHHLTALYEIVAPQGGAVDVAQAADHVAPAGAVGPNSSESMTVRLYYMRPGDDTRRLVEQKVIDKGVDFAHASSDLRLAAAVAGFGMLLKRSPDAGNLTYPGVAAIARGTLADDLWGYRQGFVDLVDKAATVRPRANANGDAPVR